MQVAASLENLHAIVVGVSNHDAPVAVDGNAAPRSIELSVACAYGANMGAIAVAQHLHAIITFLNDNNVTCGIERDTRGPSELAGACSSAADGAEMRAVAVAQNLHILIAIVGNNKVTFAVKRNTAKASSELPVAAAAAADGADVGAVPQPMNLHATVATVVYSNVALAVNGDALGKAELPVA